MQKLSLLLMTVLLLVLSSAVLSSRVLSDQPKQTANLQVIIIDSKTSQTTKITDATQLNRFNYFWSQKQPAKTPAVYQWRYQLIIETPRGKSRWVYDPKGYARQVSMDKSIDIFLLSPIRSFNRFLEQE
ncbi:MAG: hypothetical protein DRQ47_03455 [Gammaproteobacteria bacterium]|nr:MAG: hypothetical protein DRQ47_03455 [Gammaproteobacteria bacterium]